MYSFHPIIQQWFTERYGKPTEIQSMAWPRIAGREHLLITAPTGSGKTLTAFLWAINQFAEGHLETGATRILYLSPLKALNNDIKRNLVEPLGEIKAGFEAAGLDFPNVRVMTRSGDTQPEERRRMLKSPPEILITTPESLNLLLSSTGGRTLLYDIDTLIIDEVHSVVDSKRGSYLMSAVERLVPLSGEFQRIALSATVNPLEAVAEFVAGYRREANDYFPRRVCTLVSTSRKDYQITIRFPEAASNRGEDEGLWEFLAEDMLPKINANRSTLVFVNSRALCEKLTYKLNAAAGRIVAYAHHGSLSREIRAEVEQRLKAGTLEAIVATSTLEMGIDIGALDEVILVQSPGSIASTIQRIGRAGHQVGAPSRCTIYPTHSQDFIEAAVLSSAVIERDLEPVHVIRKPLDVLAQIIVSMTGVETWPLDELFLELKRSFTYHSLTRNEFDLVINMLAGRYADHHIRELKPRLRIDRMTDRAEAHRGSLLSLYLSGGVIPDRGYYQLRHESDNARIGELDEEFVWEANVGQVFTFGTQAWQVKKITHNDVVVGHAKPGTTAPPFWISEPIRRSFHFSQRIGNFLESANRDLGTDKFREQLIHRHCAEPGVADEVIRFLERQKSHTRTDLPHRHHILFEWVNTGPGKTAGHQLVIHTGWGSAVNRPFAMALEAAWQQARGEQPEIHVANESIVMQLPDPVHADDLLAMVPAQDLEKLLRIRLEDSGFFGARFRENAGRALLISKGRFNERKPLWMSRLQSQRLMEAVMKYEDFPVLLETWRTCLHDEFDIDSLKCVLDEISAREITVGEVETGSPSPFAASVTWDQINTYMYKRDDPRPGRQSRLSEDLLREVVWSPSLRPALQPGIVDAFVRQRHRLTPGDQPQDMNELEDWVKERSMIGIAEWASLVSLLPFEHDPARFPEIAVRLVTSLEDYPRVSSLLALSPSAEDLTDLETLLANWLQYYGPMRADEIEEILGIEQVESLLASLNDAEMLVTGRLMEGSAAIFYCDSLNYEFLLRLQRAGNRLDVEPMALEGLAPFIFAWQTRHAASDPAEQLFETLESLRGLPVIPELWETEILPARHREYRPADLDALFSESAVQWLGMGERRAGFCLPGEEDLVLGQVDNTSALIPDRLARFDFAALAEKTGMDTQPLAASLWSEVWSGLVSNDSFSALRSGIRSQYTVPEVSGASGGRGARRAAFGRWRSAAPFSGNWYRVRSSVDAPDLIETQELGKERARLLLQRNGVLFRELCEREASAFGWRFLYRALRLMELSGEVVSGHFFSAVPGPQFMTPSSLRVFQEDRSEQVFFLNAADPASPCGLGLGIHGEQLPRRIASSYLVYHGQTLVLTVSRRGKELQFYVTPEAEQLADYLDVLDHLAYRTVDPVRQLRIEQINGMDAARSPYRTVLASRFNVYVDYKAVVIQREV